MPQETSTRVAIVGLGQMGCHHAEAYRRAGAVVAAVCDTNAEQAERMGGSLGIPWFTRFEDVLEQPGLQAISICTPPHLHLPMVRLAVEAGLDVLCEKPLAATLDDGWALAALLPPERVVMVCFFHRFHEPVVTLQTMLREGQLGRVLTLRNRFSLAMNADRRPWIWDPSQAGGGCVMNTSVHSIDLFRFLAGEPRRVLARLRPVPESSEPEREAVLLLEGGENDAVGLLEAYSYAPQREFTLAVQTEDAVAEIGWAPPSLRLLRPGSNTWGDLPIAASRALARIDAGVAHFLACVERRETPRASVADGIRALEVATAAYASARDGVFASCGPSDARGIADPG